MFEIGLDRIIQDPSLTKAWGRCALLSNQASIAKDFRPSWSICQSILKDRLRALFGPQHGFEATCQDNMIETAHAKHLPSGLPVFSLYSETREPTGEMLDGIDTILIDIQIVGCRIYTFKSTIAGCLRSAKKTGKRVVVFDRPNPLGCEWLEGRVLDHDATSVVGQFEMPMRHGLTAAEAAIFFNQDIGAQLEVLPMRGYDPSEYWSYLGYAGYHGGQPWVLTSPNLPTVDSVFVYPGMVIFEGTNCSEGRGTGLPFQLIGAPYIKDSRKLIQKIWDIYGTSGHRGDSGVFLRPASFQPTSQKWASEVCQGVHIHVLNPKEVRSFSLALAILRAMIELGGAAFRWKDPPYEYDYKTLPIKLILGSHQAADRMMADRFSLDDPFWHEGLEVYRKNCGPLLLYPRNMYID